ncbi:MAG: NUDIX domain-containing protein [Acidimicrobiales bacterium]
MTNTESPADAAHSSGGPDPEVELGRIGNEHFSHGGESLIHQGAVIGVYTAVIEDVDGQQFDRDVVRHPGAVAVVPVDGQDVLLVQQYRAALDADLIEIPAGKRDVAGEPPIETAKRELEEEVGMRAGTLVPLINVHHSPGFCDEYGHIFLATDLEPVPQRREGPEEQMMTIHRRSLAEAVEMCLDGQITDAKSIGGILAAARRLGVS